MGRYDLNKFEWPTILPHLPNKPRDVPCVDDRRVLNGIFWFCVRAHELICQNVTARRPRSTIASIAGAKQASGIGSWT